jgi:hypothetical protein
MSECVCTPRRDQVLNRIMQRVCPTTYGGIMAQVRADFVAPQRDKVYELVTRRAQETVSRQRAIDARTEATVRGMRAFVEYEDALEDEAHRRNVLYDAVHGRV